MTATDWLDIVGLNEREQQQLNREAVLAELELVTGDDGEDY